MPFTWYLPAHAMSGLRGAGDGIRHVLHSGNNVCSYIFRARSNHLKLQCLLQYVLPNALITHNILLCSYRPSCVFSSGTRKMLDSSLQICRCMAGCQVGDINVINMTIFEIACIDRVQENICASVFSVKSSLKP